MGATTTSSINPSVIDMSRVSGGKNIAVGEASAFGASETHGIGDFPHPFAPCRVAKQSGKAQKKNWALSIGDSLPFGKKNAMFPRGV
ncbi:MAG: hypothetical protein IKR81_11570 [Victivallales bacterium]|nr:hypothetical protein [Victivallales bacterium]